MENLKANGAKLGFYGYTVYSDGAVIGRAGKLLKLDYNRKGYPRYRFYNGCVNGKKKNKNFLAHRLIALLFVENDDPKNKTEVHHIDYNMFNLHASNFKWMTPAEHRAQTVKDRREKLKESVPF